MTRYEQIKDMTLEEMAEFICHNISGYCCDCVANDTCMRGHAGFLDWLKEEVEDGK